MKWFLSIAAALLTLSISIPAGAQDQGYPIAANVDVQGKVVELNVPAAADGMTFYVLWTSSYQKAPNRELVRARGGTHCYEMRNSNDWQGRVSAVGVTLPGVSGSIKTPNLSDEIDMFFEPERITPSAINVMHGHTLFTWSWNTYLLLLLVPATLAIAKFSKKSVLISAGLGFLLCCAVMDLRSAYDHAVIVYMKEAFHEGMPPLNEVTTFADRAGPIIGQGTWSCGAQEGVMGSCLRYRLAEHPYAAEGSTRKPEFWINYDPKSGNYTLEKKSQP